jgi:hypothetical protein
MRLQRLTGLERTKSPPIRRGEGCDPPPSGILTGDAVLQIILPSCARSKKPTATAAHGDHPQASDITIEDMIADEDMVITACAAAT